MDDFTFVVFLITIGLICLVGFVFLPSMEVKDVQYEYAYVLIGEEWQDLELVKNKTIDSKRYELHLTDNTVLVVLKVNCIFHNGSLPEVTE